MIRILSNCHTHSTFCDGRATMAEMAQTAAENGFVSLGFSSHAPQLFDAPYCMSAGAEQAYLREGDRLRKEYRGRMRIWMGVERDEYSCCDPGKYEYFIASVHYIFHRDQMLAVDGAPETLEQLLKARYSGNALQLAEEYFGHMAAYATAFHPPIIGHFDLIKKHNARLKLFDTEDSTYLNAAKEALKAIRSCGALLEVNTGGMARGHTTEPYPSPSLLRYWHSLGGQVIPSTDCHRAHQLCSGLELLPDLLRETGYDSFQILGRGDALFETVSLAE